MLLTDQVWDNLMNYIKNHPRKNLYWTDGERILCKTSGISTALADFIDAMAGYAVSVTGCYDPVEDEESGCTDEYTGWYYVTIV